MERKESSVSVTISLATRNISRRILQRRSFAGNRGFFFSHVSPDGTMRVTRSVPSYRLSHTSRLIRVLDEPRAQSMQASRNEGGGREWTGGWNIAGGRIGRGKEGGDRMTMTWMSVSIPISVSLNIYLVELKSWLRCIRSAGTRLTRRSAPNDRFVEANPRRVRDYWQPWN